MMFVKCVAKPPFGKFTVGCIYVAHDDLEGEAASRATFHLRDDQDAEVSAKFSDGQFVEIDNIYVCCVQQCGSFQPGEILRVVAVDENGFQMDGFGWFARKSFEILDNSNLTVGSYLWDEPANKWVEVKTVSDDQNVQVNGRQEFRPLNDFSMPVEDGTIEFYPKSLIDKGLQ